MDLLKKYNIKAPDLDARRKDRILQFFLEMAAGQSPDALTNVTQAAKSAGMGFAEDRRDVEKATQTSSLLVFRWVWPSSSSVTRQQRRRCF